MKAAKKAWHKRGLGRSKARRSRRGPKNQKKSRLGQKNLKKK